RYKHIGRRPSAASCRGGATIRQLQRIGKHRAAWPSVLRKADPRNIPCNRGCGVARFTASASSRNSRGDGMMTERLAKAYRAWVKYRETHAQLSGLSDRDLAD